MQYPVTVNGVTLDDWAYGVTTRTGWRSSPGIRAATVEAAHTDGILVPDRRAPLEAGQFTVSMFVRGRSWSEYTANLDTLMAVFRTQGGTVEVTVDHGDGLIRTAQARTIASWAPEHVNPVQARFTVVMEIPSGTWTAPDYEVAAYANVDVTDPVTVDCWDPTGTVTDAQLLIRDPGAAVEWTVSDNAVSVFDRQRIWLRLTLDAPVSSGRSLLFDLGQWRAWEITRPDAGDVDAAWFDLARTALVDHTADLLRSGPMFGRALLPLEPGGPRPPRTPGVRVDSVDADLIPTSAPAVVLAVRPVWL